MVKARDGQQRERQCNKSFNSEELLHVADACQHLDEEQAVQAREEISGETLNENNAFSQHNGSIKERDRSRSRRWSCTS